MADINIRVKGNSGGADGGATALKNVGDEAKKTDKALKDAGGPSGGAASLNASLTRSVAIGGLVALGLSKAAAAAWDFAKSSVKAFAEQEKADKQLAAALDQLGHSSERLLPMLKDQASAFQANLGVSDDMIQRMQALMITFGVAPKDIQKTTAAVLDYSARMGKDAVQSTETLLKATAAGGRGLKGMGIVIQDTGDKSKNLNAAVEEMGRKFGGAAQANAGTLAGQMAILDTQVDELKEAFGGFLANIATRTGALDALAEALRGVNDALNDPDANTKQLFREKDAAEKSLTGIRGHLTLQTERLAAAEIALADAARRNHVTDQANARHAKGAAERALADLQEKEKKAQAKLDEANKKYEADQAKRFNVPTKTDLDGPGGNTETEAARKAREDAARKDAEQQEDAHLEEVKRKEAWRVAELRAIAESEDAVRQTLEDADKERQRDMEEAAKEEARILQAAMEEQQRIAEQGAQMISNAFGGALQDGIASLISGQEFDLIGTMTGVIQAILQAALLSVPGGFLLAPLLGGIVGGIGSGLSAASKGSRSARAHSGAWSDDLPHRMGWEIPATLAPGERVLSAGQVQTMGGRAAVDAAASGYGRGGGAPITFNVATLDAGSFKDYLGGRGGDAFRRVANQNRGFGVALRRLGVYD